MANHKTGAQRYNDRMDKIFDRAKSEGRGLVGNSGIRDEKKLEKSEKKAIIAKKIRVNNDHDDFVSHMKKKYPNYKPEK